MSPLNSQSTAVQTAEDLLRERSVGRAPLVGYAAHAILAIAIYVVAMG